MPGAVLENISPVSTLKPFPFLRSEEQRSYPYLHISIAEQKGHITVVKVRQRLVSHGALAEGQPKALGFPGIRRLPFGSDADGSFRRSFRGYGRRYVFGSREWRR